MARLCKRERELIRHTLGPGWLKRAELEARNRNRALSDAEVMILEEDIERITGRRLPHYMGWVG